MNKYLVLIALSLFLNNVNAQTLQNAQKLTDNEQFSDAAKIYASLLKLNNNGENNFYMGENYFKQENLDSALFFYSKGLEAQPDYALNYVGKGKVNWFKGNADVAKTSFDKALELSKRKDILVLSKIAECYTQAEKKELDLALGLLTEAQKLDPKNIDVYLLTGDVYSEKQDGNKAIENYKKGQALDKANVKGLLRQGKLYGRSKNYQLAFDLYKEASNIDSTFAPAYREQAELYYLSRQYERAKAKYKRFLELSSNNIDARKRYASFMYLSKDYAETINQINMILKEDTTSNIMNRLLAYSYVEKTDYNSAQSYMNRFFIRSSPENTKILASDFEYQAKIYAKTGKDSMAIISYLKAISMDSSKTEYYGDLGSLCFKLKKNQDAIKYFKIKQNSKTPLTANETYILGKSYFFEKDYVSADTSFGTLISMSPKLQQGYFWKARVAAQNDQESTKGLAKPWYELYLEKALANNEKNLKDLEEAYSYLGYFYFISKDKENSKMYWQKVQEINPTSDKAKKALENLK